MPNLFVYIRRGFKRKIKVNFLNFREIPDFLVVSPGGCGSISLIKYLDNFGKSNLYFERKYQFFGLGHIYKPAKFLFNNKVKVIIIKRNFEDIYNSMVSRGFIKISLNSFGDPLPFIYKNILKDEKKLKKKYLTYLEKFYFNWEKYYPELILKVTYPQLYKDLDCKIKIKNFLSIKNNNFLNNFPKFERYNQDKDFIDPSTILMKSIHKDL